MQYRRLGSSDLEVSEIALGAWLTLTDAAAAERARACTDAAFEAGVNFFDTANEYGLGAAEEAWGEVLSPHPRDSYVLATKVYMPMSDEDKGLSAAQISKQIDASLGRLRTDYVDLYQAHRFDPDVELEETIEAFQRVLQEGKARYIGFSEWTPEQIRAGIEVGGEGLFVSSQPQYSMFWQVPEPEVFPLCAEHGISQIVWSPLAQGILTGKYRRGEAAPAGSRGADKDDNFAIEYFEWLSDERLATVDRLRPIADAAGLQLSELALAWILRLAEVSAAIVGASRPEQVEANCRASGVKLGADILAAIDTALGDVPVTEPTLGPLARAGVKRR